MPHAAHYIVQMKNRRGKSTGSHMVKRENYVVKPQNIGGLLEEAQCLFIRQTAARTLSAWRYRHHTTIIHRVTHRSCGIESLPRTGSETASPQ